MSPPRPSYLRPRPLLDPGFLRRPTSITGVDSDPGFSVPNRGRFPGDPGIDPGFSPQIFDPSPVDARAPDIGGGPGGPGRPRLPFNPQLRLTDPATIKPVADPNLPVGGASEPTSFKDKLSLALEGAGRSGVLDPNSEDSGTESFLGSALKAFSTVQGFRRQMSANQQAQQDKATERSSQQNLREAQAEYYRSRAHAGPTGQTQENRIELENIRHGHLLERIRTAADLRRRQAASRKEGQVTPAERVVLGRTERADVAGSRAVENERAQATRGYRDPLAPGEENDIMARIRRQTDPNYVSDSTATANVINPKLGVPRPPAPAPREDPLAPGTRTRSVLEDFLRRQSPMRTVRPPMPMAAPPPLDSSEGQSVAPPASPDEETDTTAADMIDETPVDETQGDQGDELGTDEIDAALSMIEDLEGPDAERELGDAGYNDTQVQTILAHKIRGKPE